MKLTIRALKQITLLEELDDDWLEKLTHQVVVRKYPKRQTVLQKGCSSGDLLFLLNGSLQVVDYTEDGREVVLHTVCPGDYFGELSVIDGQPRSASVVASEVSMVGFLQKKYALELFYHCPPVAKKVIERFAYIIRQASNRQVLLNISSAYTRVYVILMQMAERSSESDKIEHLPTQKELASMVNTSRETVSRAIQALKKQGIIRTDKHQLIILKKNALRALIGQSSEK
ncbi:Crp/Fnr family transcriptional regulator [Thiothrix nivea]|uniref:Transcriptional regulator, Crp/Fnr family n=1 Tax=Thiothrix nivea (strain ATCC 35100 / DSM 5205 / JP2) TaxID=870187 RepID=A0A656HFJ1_THINJ|nr:Crp/Fnr family transcriptional regulator [Thiothrix nivea]EIJ34266.1 transcriptional regulator, Crp/Fnr family [Thiothrix nivea DSM 5205]